MSNTISGFKTENLCPYCEESGCPGTSKETCNSDSKDFYSNEEDQEEWEFGFFENR